MKSNVEKVSNLSRKLNIEVPAEVVQTAFQKIFNGIQKVPIFSGLLLGALVQPIIERAHTDARGACRNA